MIARLLDLLRIRRGVWLEDHQGQPYATWAKRHPFGGWQAHVYPVFRIGHVKLHADGTCTGGACYIKRWKWMR